MNVHETRFRDAVADETSEQFVVDRSSSLLRRTAAVAATATAEAEAVDREARFPKAAIDAARQQRLLGVQIPVEGVDVTRLKDSFLNSRGQHRQHLAIDIGAP